MASTFLEHSLYFHMSNIVPAGAMFTVSLPVNALHERRELNLNWRPMYPVHKVTVRDRVSRVAQ